MSAAIGSRRRLLAVLACTPLAGGAAGFTEPVQPVSPDAGLRALCARFEALQQRANGFWAWRKGGVRVTGPEYIDDEDEREAALAPIEAAMRPIIDGICDALPQTIAGARAVARCLVLWDHERLAVVEREREDAFDNDRLIACLLRGLLAGEELRPVWYREA